MFGGKALVCAFLAMFIMAAICEARAVEKGLNKRTLHSKRDTFIAKLRKRSATGRCISDDDEELCVEDGDCCSGSCLTMTDDEFAGLILLIALMEAEGGSGDGSNEHHRRGASSEELGDLTEEDIQNLIILGALFGNEDSDERTARGGSGSGSDSDSEDRTARSASGSGSDSDSEDRTARSGSGSGSDSDSEDRTARSGSGSGSGSGSDSGSGSGSEERRPAKRVAFARRDVGFCIPGDNSDSML
jgi:hypothetical protein